MFLENVYSLEILCSSVADLVGDYRTPPPDGLRLASRQWRLLMQIDSDADLKMNWWDGGRLYVFARTRDLKRGDFSKTVTITQTH